jgi:hydroxymethylpyrimidine pyrophosphatase-like HAD family hydrolase
LQQRSAWSSAQHDLALAEQALPHAPTANRQSAYDQLLAARRNCTSMLHAWLGAALELEPVREPTMMFSLDVDGVLEEEALGFSAASLSAVAALKLLQLGGVAVVLNTARSLDDVRERVERFHLPGGVAGYGAATLDAVYDRQQRLTSDDARAELDQLAGLLRGDKRLVFDSAHGECVRVADVSTGLPRPIEAERARQLIDTAGLHRLTVWVASEHTDFVDHGQDKAAGINALAQEMGLAGLPSAAMGDSRCDLPMLRAADWALLPAATLDGYAGRAGQKVFRTRAGPDGLWEAGCRLVPSARLQRECRRLVAGLDFPAWLPASLGRHLPSSAGLGGLVGQVTGQRGRGRMLVSKLQRLTS